ncbi:hypothetical protein JR316_0011344 [Psilocybe cubensis]|uniref:Uncharacterized protein n=2 Tax=Psilocybe cubensis TaxID=181762 RepID=A0A8H8CJ97_PSICU|nr:hypothetical protein JR316_0011344 [Psilocybe cubensis]KAH9475785.1 hypothetical protein JR316_0011344 [Psilocybe cubensis]
MIWSLLTAFVIAGIHGAATAAGTSGPAACVTFDINWNLLAFGFNGKDYNAGTQDTWTSSSAPTDITTQGRPPFDSANTTCYLAQFFNAIYVLNADSSSPSSIYIYDVAKASWSKQSVDVGTFDPTNFAAILDHDTNVFYSYSAGDMFSLDMQSQTAAIPSAIPWKEVQKPDLSSDPDGTSTPGANTAGYEPVMALAQNHVHFLGVPGLAPGNAKIFVIHFSFMQPAPQFYGTAFPDTHGKAASFFLDSGVQQEFAFIPDDGSATYVINVESNTTKTLSGPPQRDPFASYSASTSALVQLNTAGQVAFLAYDPKTTTSGGTWATISKLPSALSSGSSSNGSSATGNTTGSSGSGSGTNSSSGNSSGSSNNNKSDAVSSIRLGAGMFLAAGMTLIGMLSL